MKSLVKIVDPTSNIKARMGHNRRISSRYAGYPLHVACWLGSPETIKILLRDPRVDVNHKGGYSYNAFHIVCRRGYSEIVEMMLNDPVVDVATIPCSFTSYEMKRTDFYTGDNSTVRCTLLPEEINVLSKLSRHQRTSHYFDLDACVRVL